LLRERKGGLQLIHIQWEYDRSESILEMKERKAWLEPSYQEKRWKLFYPDRISHTANFWAFISCQIFAPFLLLCSNVLYIAFCVRTLLFQWIAG
jgi:hypothetical protein